MRYLFLIGIIHSFLHGQSVSPSVIHSAGNYTMVSSGPLIIEYSDNIGETFVATLQGSNYILTQGFLQPNYNPVTTLNHTLSHVSCLDKRDGNIKISIQYPPSSSTIITYWYPPDICPDNDCFEIDSLSAGTYSVKILFLPSHDSLTQVFTIEDSQEPCTIKIFSGITISGNNPFLYIENIEQYPDNSITIFSRWGNLIKTINGYNNKDKKWPDEKDKGSIMSGTYYYILKLKKNGKPIKGWLEVIE